MFSFEDEIKKILKKQAHKPYTYEIAIKKVFDQNEKKANKIMLPKILAIACCGMIAFTCIAFATNTVYEKIWRNPEKIKYIDELKVTEKDKQNIISEEDAKKIANDLYKKFGYNSVTISKAQIEKNPTYGSISWVIETEQKIYLKINATKGTLEEFAEVKSDTYKDLGYRITKKEAEKTANLLYSQLGYKEGEYKLSYLNGNRIDDDKNSYFWQAYFYKTYEGIPNEYERISITFIPVINKIISVGIVENVFQNNPIVVSKEDTIKIAKEKNKQINQFKIKEITTELKIVKMNEYIYMRENGNINENEQFVNKNGDTEIYNPYKDSKIIRKVWGVKISYEDNINKDVYIEYYVDVTTGEIIGGYGVNLNEK